MSIEQFLTGFKNMTITNSMVIELITELAHKRVVEGNCQKIWKDEDSWQVEYTEEAQKLFDEYYDDYDTIIRTILYK